MLKKHSLDFSPQVYLTGITPLPAEAIEYEDMLINLDIYYPHMQYRRFTGKNDVNFYLQIYAKIFPIFQKSSQRFALTA